MKKRRVSFNIKIFLFFSWIFVTLFIIPTETYSVAVVKLISEFTVTISGFIRQNIPLFL